MKYDIDLTPIQRQAIIDRRTAIASTATTEQLRQLMLDVLNLLIDDPQYTAADRQFSREMDVSTGKPRLPEYAHEFLMQNDEDYYHAWAYQFVDWYPEYADANNLVTDSVNRGLAKHTYFENDDDIVWRSMLRNGLRYAEEGEDWPPPVIGANAPEAVINMPRIVVTTTGGGGFY